ncbi:MAG: hypothetical protein IJ161_08595 [Bacteroidales bacterium]|nr:hypothetical protein [Bacteroidales bacterium]
MPQIPLHILILAIIGLISCTGVKSSPELAHDSDVAWSLLRSGDDADAMEAHLRLADEYHRKGDYDNESIALFSVAQVYLQQLDTNGMRSILPRMETLANDHPDLPNVVYSYHTVKQTFHAVLFQEAGREEDRDVMFSEGTKAILIMEKMNTDQLAAYHVNPVWNYYNMAVGYDLYFDPPERDSIEHYLEKAREANKMSFLFADNVQLEGEISIGDEQAWLHYYDGEYEKAEKQMFAVLEMIDSVEVKTPNVVQTERIEAYDFLVELYSATGRLEEALHYQQLKSEAELRRIGVERNEAVHKVQSQYDVAKAEAKVMRLRLMLILLASAVLLLAAAVLYLHLWRRNRLQMQYTAAAEALVETDAKVKALTENVSATRSLEVFSAATKPLSAVERKYIMLFMSGKTTEEIADAMHVAPSSVYTMKYRIRKKFPEGYPLPF